MKSKHYELILNFDNTNVCAADVLIEALVNQGVALDSIVESDMLGKGMISVYLNSREEAQSLRKELSSALSADVQFKIQTVFRKDWQELWKKEFKPFALTETLQVIPTWLKEGRPRDRRREAVYIDTSLAFGTGLHATTRFMSQLIERVSGKFTNFLDIGTGTGILAIVASKKGAQEIWAVDISKEAVKIAEENLKVNNVVCKKLWAGDFDHLQSKQQFDFVAANLITQDLIILKKKILTRVSRGGYLAVSGISLKNYPMFRESFSSSSLKCLKIYKGEGWVALLFKKS